MSAQTKSSGAGEPTMPAVVERRVLQANEERVVAILRTDRGFSLEQSRPERGLKPFVIRLSRAHALNVARQIFAWTADCSDLHDSSFAAACMRRWARWTAPTPPGAPMPKHIELGTVTKHRTATTTVSIETRPVIGRPTTPHVEIVERREGCHTRWISIFTYQLDDVIALLEEARDHLRAAGLETRSGARPDLRRVALPIESADPDETAAARASHEGPTIEAGVGVEVREPSTRAGGRT